MTKKCKSHLNKIVTRARPVEQGAEKYKQEDETRGDTKSDAKHTFGCNPQMAHGSREGSSLPGNEVWGHVSEKHIGQKDERHHGQRRT